MNKSRPAELDANPPPIKCQRCVAVMTEDASTRGQHDSVGWRCPKCGAVYFRYVQPRLRAATGDRTKTFGLVQEANVPESRFDGIVAPEFGAVAAPEFGAVGEHPERAIFKRAEAESAKTGELVKSFIVVPEGCQVKSLLEIIRDVNEAAANASLPPARRAAANGK